MGGIGGFKGGIARDDVAKRSFGKTGVLFWERGGIVFPTLPCSPHIHSS